MKIKIHLLVSIFANHVIMRHIRDVIIIVLRSSDPTDNLLVHSQKLAVLMNSLKYMR
jgi:hypothetical protein